MELIITEKPTNPSICLNMIVKNESHIIKKTLENLCSKIEFSYWVICDTGSTDNTCEIIVDFFSNKNIPGELHKDEWQNFAHNRTVALQRAFGKSDLLLVFDADDEIVGQPELPGVNATIYDEYHLKFGSPLGTSYTRILLVNNNKRFVYQSVIHEYIVCVEPANIPRTNTVIQGDYYVVSGRSGNRSLDPEKYLKDAKILEAAHAEAVLQKDPLFKRYAFYCANSYKDYGSLEEAIKWYKITLSQENWAQEHYMSCFHIYECYQKLNQVEQGFFYLVKAFQYDQERVECLYPLLVHYCCEGQYKMAYNYYLQVKDFYETKYLSTNLDGKLFVSIDKYNFFVPYYMILIADKMKDFDCVIKMFEIVFTKKMQVADDHYVGNILFNLQFFVQRVKSENMERFINLATEYIRFLSDLGIQLQRHEFLREYKTRFGIDVSYIFSNVVLNNKMNFSKEECKKSKNILIYTGLMYFLWNDTYVSTKSIGGAEKAVAYLFRYFSKEYNIFISGDVEDEVIDNVTYINRDKLQNLLEKTKFHTIIVSRYISFFLMYNNFSCYKLFLSAHDSTGFINNYNNNRLSLNDIVETWNPIIDGCIALTTWHKNNIIERHPCLKDKIHIINNGILPEIFPLSSKKIRNKFVWTSCSYRGLHVMLNLWKDILECIPDATLDIASYDIFPKNADDLPMQEVIMKYPNSIKHRGKLNTSELNNLISTAEYWLYTNTFPETSCITGMEMLMSEVICLYYPLAGLLDTVGEYGIQVNPGSEVDTILNLTEKQKIIMRKRGKDYALTCSWENRAKEWENVLFENENDHNSIKSRIYELHNTGFIPKNHVEFLQNLSKDFQPTVVYDIGANVLSWTRESRKIWPNAEIVAFDAINTAEFLYKEHNVKYHIGVLSKEDNNTVKFYENLIHPAGNSYYKEIGHTKSNEIYPEEAFTEQKTITLTTAVQKHKFLLPDLIKIDVQGTELDIIKGGLDIINNAKYLIVELQNVQYNRGAPLASTTIQFLEDNDWELISPKFCDNGPDADYCFKNKRIFNEPNSEIKTFIRNLYDKMSIPKDHVNYLKKLAVDFEPKIVYDIGSAVLHWKREAHKIWPNSEIIAFEASEDTEFFYKEHNIKYNIGVLSDENDKIVKFYGNIYSLGGNSYYKEIGHTKSNEIYPEDLYTEQKTMTLASVVSKNNFQLPDLIKIDVQGAELDIMKGGIDIINNAKYLIVELQDTQYNRGAPLADVTIKFLEDNNWELISSKFCDNGPDADYCFKNKRYDSNFKIKIINLARRPDRKEKMINDLALQNVYNYEFVEATDGKILEPSIFIKNLFKDNNFNYRKGVIGCALSHYTLWHKLLNDVENDHYVILEDDISIVEHFNRKLQKCIDIVTENNIEYALIGSYYIHNECSNHTNISFHKETIENCHGTFGYIISRSACYKLIKHIQTNGIKYAIDYSPIYTDCLDMYKINNTLVTAKAYHLDNNMDTDIQLDNDYLNFDSIPTYQIAFTDWWSFEYCGGTFDQENNFLKNMLSKYYNIRVVNPEHNPDILFYSVFGNNHKNLQAKRKVFFSGEPHSQREDADYNVTFDANSDRNCRLPLWVCYLDNILFDDCYQKNIGTFKLPDKPNFCSIICQDCKIKERIEIVNKLSKYQRVDCGGTFLNNIGYIVPRGINCSGKIEHNNNYKFVIAFENTNYPGYVTEKICDVYKSKCIPIYWGSKEVVNDFNPRTFINANDFANFDELVEYIEKVDNNQELYERYFMEPIFSNYWLNIFNDIDQTFFSDLANNIVGNNHKITSKIEPNNVFFNSQSGQDEYVESHIFKGYKNGFYVDVGAHDGITINNTLYFEKSNNWTGINIEPIKTVFDKLVNNRPNNINLNCAVCNNDGETEFLCNTGYTEMISGIKSNFDPRHLQRLDNENRQMGSTTEVIKVTTKKLETIFNENNISHINYLSIDVEGAEFEVIKSINFDKVFIDLIEFENNFDDVSIPIVKYLETNNYVVCNTYGDIFMINKNSIFYKPNLKTFGFHSNQLCERGTDVAMYDYAYYNEKMYNNKSIIFYCKHNSNNDADVIKKFETQFKCYGYDKFSDIEQIIQDERIDYFYNCKSGSISDNQLIKSCPNLIHAVFTVEPHGEKYAAISKQLSEKYNNIADFVPYMINLPKCDKNARRQFNIPNDAIVIGRYGGYYQFDIQVAHEAIKSILNTELNLYFLFANTNVFYEHPRIIYLNKIIDLEDKVTFINTCDAMIHARSDGETFGLAVGEFSSCNKPIITCKSAMDNSHIDILGEKGIIYGSKESLIKIFKNIKNIINSRSDWNAYTEYSPENVMEKFFKVFIDSSKIIDYNKINYIDMNRSCISTSNKNDPNLIIVSVFLDIGRDNWDKYERTTQLYINSFLNYLNYDNKMIIFIDDMYINEIKEKYEQSLYKNKIFIPINIEWMKQNIYAWQKLELDRSIMNSEIYKTTVQNRINNNYPENIYPEYNAINHAKIDFICYAINNNLIGKNDFIGWSDFGYFNSILHNNSKLYPVAKLGINNFNLNKLSFCLRNKLDENDNDMFYTFINAPEKFTGSFFSGPINLMIELQELYHKSLEELHANNISDDDQHLYLRCFLKNPDIFELYLSNNEWPKALIYFEQAPTKNNIYTFDVNQSTCLCEIMGKYGSDKGHINIMESHHNYTTFYYSIFKNIQMEQLRIFELGLGTNNVNIKSNMGINGSPGASLYGWREFFINSKIYGADIDKDILFNTDKIKTFYCDQTNSDIIKSLWNNLELNENFDIIIEDGLHDFNANVCFFENSIHKLKPNGYFIIEDILNYEEQLFIIKIKEWETKYIDCLFTLLKIPSLRNNSDNTLLVVFKRTI